jgi:hypothetical protein
MAIKSTLGKLATSGTRAKLNANASLDVALSQGITFSIASDVTSKVWWGGSDLTTSNGYLVQSGSQIAPAEVGFISDIYLISDGTPDVYFNIVGQKLALT